METRVEKPTKVKDTPRYRVCTKIEEAFQAEYAQSLGAMLTEVVALVKTYVEQDLE